MLQYIAALRPADTSTRKANTLKQARIDIAQINLFLFCLSATHPLFVAQHHRN